MDDLITIMDEKGRWKARDITYWSGNWQQLRKQIPEFRMDDFKVSEKTPPNPYLKSIVRMPVNIYEQPIPVAVTSNNYTLAQHFDVAEKCFEGIHSAQIDPSNLKCELGLTQLGEWMNLRIYFPDKFNHTPKDKSKIELRLECVNSVDGSSRLIILFSWLRLVCTNGMVIRETRTEIRDIHNENLDLERIPLVVRDIMQIVRKDLGRLKLWETVLINIENLKAWVNEKLAQKWGIKAATRVYHICLSGHDVEFETPFSKGAPTEKPVVRTLDVPGAPSKANNLFDVSQALSWVATGRNNPEERLEMQTDVPELIDDLYLLVTGHQLQLDTGHQVHLFPD